jgi:adenine-specific DNA-methyltransferase
MLDKESLDIKEKRIENLRETLPEIFAEDKIDIIRFKEAIGEYIDSGNERYMLSWAGKSNSIRVRDRPSRGTLAPFRQESINFDSTRNIFIEGENLEVLKIILKAYEGEIKMIYLDPPYNTGKDFIYKDDFADNLKEYLKYTSQAEESGRLVTTNPETSGRFHSNWLSMMYPRLFLAHYLLKPDGFIFVSIDDKESYNLRLMMNEIFGPENFVADITVVNNPSGRSDKKYIAVASEHLFLYRKSESAEILGLPISPEILEEYNKTDSRNGERYRLTGLRKRGSGSRRKDRENLYYAIYVDKLTEEISLQRDERFSIEVYPRLENGEEGRWRWEKIAVEERRSELIGKQVKRKGKLEWDIFQIDYLFKNGEEKKLKMKSFLDDSDYTSDTATTNLRALFDGKKVFDNPKSPYLIEDLVQYVTQKDDIILDFTAGSGTTAQAVLSLNAKDGNTRRFILIQFPEKIPENHEAFELQYSTIADVCKERIRRVITQIKTELKEKLPEQNHIDLGFKTFKLSESNCFIWDDSLSMDLGTVTKQIELSVNGPINVNEEFLVFELMLKEGFKLDSNIEKISDDRNKFYKVSDKVNTLWMCFDSDIKDEYIEKLEIGKDDKVILLDRFLTDTQKVNLSRKYRVETV